ncbi:sigma-70 family RNA polymerase sigma factor [Chitinophaga agrisoli]|uniref:Sigma-70 family RNA polymerase sigma factor n=1 Tax=Chitinophaga agrisoli TaxID=2607653 RepID=A0A5B2W0U7_9BACT|nr:sigma-70 family RNA polymerase sigma factor [Chitinophaga agrisoli]KAA2245311.1 sigma-70 family RNA polymerase sigma factor [Chitinophaga agrisoli]
MNTQQHIDPAIWEACKEGDKAAYAHIYKLYYPRLYNYGCKFTVDAALIEDSIQEIFVRFWTNREKLLAVRELKSYLFVSFRHHLLKLLAQYRRNREDHILADGYAFDLEISAEQQRVAIEEQLEQVTVLNNALHHLTQRQKEAVFFRFYEDMSYEEIASILNISVKATYKLVARAIVMLRDAYHNAPLVKALVTLAPLIAALGSLQLSVLICAQQLPLHF